MTLRFQMTKLAASMPKNSTERKALLEVLAAQPKEAAIRTPGFKNMEEVVALLKEWRGDDGWGLDDDLLAGRKPKKDLLLDNIFGLGVALGRGKASGKEIKLVAGILKGLV